MQSTAKAMASAVATMAVMVGEGTLAVEMVTTIRGARGVRVAMWLVAGARVAVA